MIRYDLTRAARAGGFDEDLELGRAVAVRLHDAVRAHTVAGQPTDVDAVIDAALSSIADLFDPLPEHERGGWLAAMTNALVEMLRDVQAQAREALDGVSA
jgi:hypothetical protein